MILLDRKHSFSNRFYDQQEIHSFKKSSYLSKGKNQCFVSFIIGISPVMVDFGLIKSVAFKVEPHFSHWSP